jgi:hypothetical protein
MSETAGMPSAARGVNFEVAKDFMAVGSILLTAFFLASGAGDEGQLNLRAGAVPPPWLSG